MSRVCSFKYLLLSWLALPSFCASQAWSDATTDAQVTLQTRHFAHEGFSGQARFQPSLAFELEVVANPTEDDQFVFTPFFRFDREDAPRTHGDVRELYWAHIEERWELNVGVRQVFWGVTEFHHLVDIINQTDAVENIDDEDRLGQPMVQLSLVRDWGTLDLYLLTGSRERTFAGSDGRLGLPLKIDDSRSQYASGAEQHRLDGAVRWTFEWAGIDVALHHFSGTSRDPQLTPSVDGSRLTPTYHVIDQTGIDAQLLRGAWAVKLEALSRSGDGDRYTAAVAGFEHTTVGWLDSSVDLGIVVEYLFDDRDERASNTLFEHELAVGARFTLNDAADTNALVGLLWDTQTGERIFSLEAQRQLGTDWAMSLEARWFGGSKRVPIDDPWRAVTDRRHRAGFLEQEDFLQFELTRYF